MTCPLSQRMCTSRALSFIIFHFVATQTVNGKKNSLFAGFLSFYFELSKRHIGKRYDYRFIHFQFAIKQNENREMARFVCYAVFKMVL